MPTAMVQENQSGGCVTELGGSGDRHGNYLL